ncbi:MAG TPA: D-aminoacylase [Candidatus Baltobacteraceae bacterium]|nr:D-aminoacylase [Candidatus Baltobacteraceae bacterium]
MRADRYVIAGALVYDGEGSAPAAADVYVAGGLIERVVPSADSHPGRSVLDASGYALCPGFIDVHSHGDNAPFVADDASKITQGITTEVVGNCGISIAPYDPAHADAYYARLPDFFPGVPRIGPRFCDVLAAADERGYVTNYAPLVGHGNVRAAVVGESARPASAGELRRMRALVAEALDAGAFGMSTGLIYPPGAYADTGELVALAEALGEQHVFTSHIRGESDALVASVEEIIEIGRRSARRVHVSHHKAAGKANWGTTRTTLAMLDRARADGVAVTQDVYPYRAGSTSLTAALPPRYHDGGVDALLERLRAPGAAGDLRRAIPHGEPGWDNLAKAAGWDGILVSTTRDHRFEGRTLAQLAHDLGGDPVDALIHVLLEESGSASMILFLMDEDDIERVLADPHTSIGTDGVPPGLGGKPHPRTFGTFPRVLGEYVRERNVLQPAEAIRRMTSLAADTFGLAGRGRIAEACAADLVVFDPRTISDDLDYHDPVRPPRGIRFVIQSGAIVCDGGRYLGGRYGARLTPVRA